MSSRPCFLIQRFQFIPKHKRLSDAGLGPGTKLANWNLQIIATHPNYVRKGVCRTMIEIVERKVGISCPWLGCCFPLSFLIGISEWPPHVHGGTNRSQRKLCHLSPHWAPFDVSSTAQVGIFRRLGFEVAAEPLLFEGLDGVFPMWIMKKETKSITGRVP